MLLQVHTTLKINRTNIIQAGEKQLHLNTTVAVLLSLPNRNQISHEQLNCNGRGVKTTETMPHKCSIHHTQRLDDDGLSVSSGERKVASS